MLQRSLWLLLLAGAILAASEVAHLTTVPVGGFDVPAIWPPVGIILGFLVLARGAYLPLVLTGAGAIAAGLMWHDWPPVAAVGVGLIHGAEAACAAWLLRTRLGGPMSLGTTSHVALFMGVAAGASFVGGLAVGLWLDLVLPGLPFASATLAWGVGDVVGLVLTTPFVLGLAELGESGEGRFRPMRLLEFGGLLVVGVLVAWGVFGERLPASISTPAILLPVFLWSCFRFGAGGVSGVMLLVAAIAVWYSSHGQGPYALPDALPLAWIHRTQGTSTMAALSFISLGSVVEERRRAMEERAALVVKLQTALAELRVLQGLIPICAWCHRIRDDAGYWQRIEAYVEANTAATFSHSICPGCTASQERVLEEAVAEAVSVVQEGSAG